MFIANAQDFLKKLDRLFEDTAKESHRSVFVTYKNYTPGMEKTSKNEDLHQQRQKTNPTEPAHITNGCLIRATNGIKKKKKGLKKNKKAVKISTLVLENEMEGFTKLLSDIQFKRMNHLLKPKNGTSQSSSSTTTTTTTPLQTVQNKKHTTKL